MEIFQSKLAFIKLPIQEYFVNDSLNKSLESCRRWIFKGPGRSLYCVGQQNEACLFGLRLGTRVPEMLHIDGILAF